jgi:hypothetical protein
MGKVRAVQPGMQIAERWLNVAITNMHAGRPRGDETLHFPVTQMQRWSDASPIYRHNKKSVIVVLQQLNPSSSIGETNSAHTTIFLVAILS